MNRHRSGTGPRLCAKHQPQRVDREADVGTFTPRRALNSAAPGLRHRRGPAVPVTGSWPNSRPYLRLWSAPVSGAFGYFGGAGKPQRAAALQKPANIKWKMSIEQYPI